MLLITTVALATTIRVRQLILFSILFVSSQALLSMRCALSLKLVNRIHR